MINRLVLAFGPPKCGQYSAGKVLLNKHNWGHVSLRRSVEKVDELFIGLNVTETLKTSDAVDDDIAVPAFMLRLAECTRLENGKNVFFEGLFKRPSQVTPMIEHAAKFARSIEVVEFQLSDELVWKRIGTSGDTRYISLEFGQTNLATYRKNLRMVRNAAKAKLSKLNVPGKYYEVNASEAPDDIAKRIFSAVKKVA